MFATARKDQWHASCGANGVPYRDSASAIRERIVELERERKEIDRQLTTLCGRLADLAAARSRERREHIWNVLERGAAVATLLVLGLGTGACVLIGWLGFLACDPMGAEAETAVRDIRRVATSEYRRTRSCPTAERLVAQGRIHEDSGLQDPWGNQYWIECVDSQVVVHSSGPDKLWFTDDDISVGRAQAEPVVPPSPQPQLP